MKNEKETNISSLEKLQTYVQSLEKFLLPEYKELSDIPLYMEQVVSYIEGVLSPLMTDKTIITPFMVNNYVKAKIVEPPENKKYSKDHVGYLLAISLLKQTASMKDIASLIEYDKYLSPEKEGLYTNFRNIYQEVLKSQAHRVKIRLDTLDKEQKKTSTQKKKNNEELELKQNQVLALIALRLFIESEACKMIADEIMNDLSLTIFQNKEALDETKKEQKIKVKKESKEAKRIANRK